MSDRSLAIVLAIGFILLFAAVVVLVWTRWGQARPIAKCAGLSFAAHVLLLLYAYSTRMLFDQPGSWLGQTVKVRILDARDDEEAAFAPELDDQEQLWSRPGDEDSSEFNVYAQRKPGEESLGPQSTAIARTSRPAEPPATLPKSAAVEPPAPMPSEDIASGPGDLANLLNEIPLPRTPPPEPSPPEPSLPADVPNPSLAANSGSDADPLPLNTVATPVAVPATVPRRLGDGEPLAEPLRARVVADRLKVAQPFGATPQSEAAVSAALEWLAANQSEDGRWDADQHGAGKETKTLGHDRQGAGAKADTGVTGLALLAFLGNGQTHLEGHHRENVQHGLEFLLGSQAANGSLAGNSEFFASMYCHGIATLALSEAYALTGDERLLSGLNKALRYTIAAQHAGGGWRYQPYDQGDMSQFGWQLMALHSAELAGIKMPAETRTRMARFLRAASSGPERGLASYRPGDRVSRSMTAEALVCRQFLAAENRPATLTEAATYIVEEKPGDGQTNLYYWYYGTLALFQRQGPEWEAWNVALQRELLYSQRQDGNRRGSWDPDPLWGGYGGRVYSTSMAALSLEVYYRYLPLHGRETELLTDRPVRSPLPR